MPRVNIEERRKERGMVTKFADSHREEVKGATPLHPLYPRNKGINRILGNKEQNGKEEKVEKEEPVDIPQTHFPGPFSRLLRTEGIAR